MPQTITVHKYARRDIQETHPSAAKQKTEVEVGGEYTFKGNFTLVRVIAVTPTKVRYTDSTGFFVNSIPREEFERSAIRIIRHKRKGF